MNKKEKDLLLLELSIYDIRDDPVKLKQTCRKIYNRIKNKPYEDVYDIMSAMSYGHVCGIKKMPEIEKAISARKRTNNWSKIIGNMACDMLFHTINGNYKKALSIMFCYSHHYKPSTTPYNKNNNYNIMHPII